MARPAMLLSLVVVACCLAIESALGCGYQSCPSSYNTSKVQLHVIPHSHDDVGWLKTADGYYDEDVSKVLTNVVHSLQRNPKRKFVEVEIYYFSRWWQRQDKQMQTVVQNLVKSGQLTFANGGWVVHDEASTFYSNIIDQMTLGIQFVRNTFGECAEPKLSWQVDPFGASREVANLYALMGFDGHIVNRGHNLHGEFLWNTSDYNSILTSVLHNHYSAPNGFDFEDGNDITDQNKAQKAKELAELGKKWNVDYGKKGHVLITFGDDFKYQHAEHYYSNLDKIIEEVNKNHPDVNLFYSSPQCYIKAIKDLKPKLEVHSHDYFPLWTGHYSSRPQVKYLDRYANNLLQAAKQLEVTAELSHTQSLIFESSNELGVLQHHDAITGTSKEFVTVDYKERLSSAILAASTVISHALGKLINKGAHVSNGLPIIYHTVNISEVDLTFEGGLASIVYNPLVHKQTTWVRIPVSESTNYKVYDFEGKEVPKVSHVPINSKVKSMVGHHRSISYELVFSAKLPALGYTTFFLVKSGSGLSQNKKPIAVNAEQELVMKGKNVELVLDGKTGKVKHLVKGGKVHRLGQSFHYYPSKGTSSSYEFCPSGGSVDLSDYSSSVVSAVQYDGFAEVTQQVNGWIWQTVRLYEDKEYAEFDWIIGPVAEQPDIGKDVITRFETDLDTRKTFWTDANGRQDIERIRDEEPRECHGTHNAISYNYYPITSRALLKDAQSGLELALLTDRSVGASSLEDGQLELMLHRRLLDRKTTDIPVDDRDADGKGVIARGKVIMFFSDKNTAADNYRPMNQILSMQPVIGFVPTSNFTQFRNDHQVQYSALKAPLPENVHLLTLQNWGGVGNNEVLLRLENFYQPHDASKLAATSTSISVADVFANPKLNIHSLAQTNLVVGSKHNATAAQSGISPSQIASYLVKVNRNVSTSCGLKWEKRLSGGKLPPNAIQAGHESDGRPMYICRHADGDLIPGKYSETIKCHVSLGGGEQAFNDDGVEILTGAEGQYLWAPRHGGDMIAPTAFVAGHNSQGVPIYSGRCVKQERGQVLGKIDPSGGAGYFYYPFGGSEHSDCSNHEILVC